MREYQLAQENPTIFGCFKLNLIFGYLDRLGLMYRATELLPEVLFEEEEEKEEKEEKSKVFEKLEKASKQGSATGSFVLGVMFFEHRVFRERFSLAESEKIGLDYLKKAVAQGDPDAQQYLDNLSKEAQEKTKDEAPSSPASIWGSASALFQSNSGNNAVEEQVVPIRYRGV